GDAAARLGADARAGQVGAAGDVDRVGPLRGDAALQRDLRAVGVAVLVRGRCAGLRDLAALADDRVGRDVLRIDGRAADVAAGLEVGGPVHVGTAFDRQVAADVARHVAAGDVGAAQRGVAAGRHLHIGAADDGVAIHHVLAARVAARAADVAAGAVALAAAGAHAQVAARAGRAVLRRLHVELAAGVQLRGVLRADHRAGHRQVVAGLHADVAPGDQGALLARRLAAGVVVGVAAAAALAALVLAALARLLHARRAA